PTSPEKVKTKLMSVWNNVKYGWTVRTRTSFNKDAPIWLLGVIYHRKMTQFYGASAVVDDGASFDAFLEDFSSRLWFTYRREFPAIPGTDIRTDCGWGCMLRSSQMILAQAFVMHLLGRQWRWQQVHTEAGEVRLPRHALWPLREGFRCTGGDGTAVLVRCSPKPVNDPPRWFGDKADASTPFSLHNLVQRGRESGKKAGDWYGPSSVAYILKDALEDAAHRDQRLAQLCIYVAQDCTIYMDDVTALCSAGSTEGVTHRRLPRTVFARREMFSGGQTQRMCIHSSWLHLFVFFVCFLKYGISFLLQLSAAEEKVIYLDPHYCQEMVDVNSQDFPLDSFHCSWPRKMSFSRIDPSCTIGFYCKTKHDLEDFTKNIRELTVPKQMRHEYPVFLISEGSCSDHTDTEKRPEEIVHVLQDVYSRDGSVHRNSEEYVVL
ncbi:cysteine protease, putative, partial [Ixodes scapularis]